MQNRALAAREAHLALLDLKRVVDDAARTTHAADLEAVPSGVTSKPASWGHFKSGQWKVPGTLDVVPVHALFNQA
jgi:hypothetical protein